jgi:hypothetical protein
MMRIAALVVLFFCVYFNHSAIASTDSLLISISGIAFDSKNTEDVTNRLPDLMIINERTSQGSFGLADGSFRIDIFKSDTIIVASTGYEFIRICFNDSVYKPKYFVRIPLTKLNVNLKEVNIFSPRDLQSIYNDIKKLGYNKKDFELSGVDAFSSPITFLYQEFNRLERLKRQNAERVNNDKRKELLRQLLANYVAHDIINMDNNEFDDFIDFCNVPESYLKNATQYDFCIYIKEKFEVYAMMKQHR